MAQLQQETPLAVERPHASINRFQTRLRYFVSLLFLFPLPNRIRAYQDQPLRPGVSFLDRKLQPAEPVIIDLGVDMFWERTLMLEFPLSNARA